MNAALGGPTGAFAAFVFLIGCATPGPADAPYAFEPRECPFETNGEPIACGIVEVPESYDSPDGRRIELNVVVLRAEPSAREPAAIFELEGGPGLGATDLVAFYRTDGAEFRRDHDIVLADMRGTGRSNPLRCLEMEAYAGADPNAPMFPPALVARCANEVRAHADASRYNTNDAAADLNAIIDALGYTRVRLIATSYGTTLAQALMTLDSVRPNPRIVAAVLHGLAPNGVMPPSHHAPAAQRALELYFLECAAEPACNAAFPDLRGDLERVRARYASSDPPAAPPSFEIFMEKLRTRMYAPAGANRLPAIIHAAAQGDFSAFAADAVRPGGGRLIVDGLYLSMTCAESFPHLDLSARREEARRTLFGDYRLRVQAAACEQWRVDPSLPHERAAPDPRIPVLFVSGRLDPVTAPSWVGDGTRRYPNSRHIVIEDGGHGQNGLLRAYPCIDEITRAFFADPRPAALDASCIAQIERPPFALQ